jgi:hypothetical protein
MRKEALLARGAALDTAAGPRAAVEIQLAEMGELLVNPVAG